MSFIGSLTLFVARYLRYDNTPSGSEGELRAFWEALCVDDKWLSELVSIDIRWDGRNVVVAQFLSESVDSWGGSGQRLCTCCVGRGSI